MSKRGNSKPKPLIKGSWTENEDKKLKNLVDTYGPKKWSVIASHLPGRIGKQCRERWYNHLDPSVRKEEWTAEEDQLIIKLHKELGNQWAQISKMLPGRPANSVKNHWNSSLRRRVESQGYDDVATIGHRKRKYSSKDVGSRKRFKKDTESDEEDFVEEDNSEDDNQEEADSPYELDAKSLFETNSPSGNEYESDEESDSSQDDKQEQEDGYHNEEEEEEEHEEEVEVVDSTDENYDDNSSQQSVLGSVASDMTSQYQQRVFRDDPMCFVFELGPLSLNSSFQWGELDAVIAQDCPDMMYAPHKVYAPQTEVADCSDLWGVGM